MTPKDKAKQLIDKFTVVGLQQRNEGIACALIAVDELIEHDDIDDYWIQVKKEIEKL